MPTAPATRSGSATSRAAFFGHRDLAAQLAEAMRSRAVIEQAKGILIARRQCDADNAFEILVHLSQTANRKLREVAEAIVTDASGGSAVSSP